MRADAVGCNRIEQERVAVGLRFGDARGRDGAAGTAAIDDDDRLSERLVQLGADGAREEVGRAAGRHWYDQRERPRRISVGARDIGRQARGR